MGVDVFTLINWERDRTTPVASRFRPVIEFLGYDPMPKAVLLEERVKAMRRRHGLTFRDLAARLGWDEGALTRYLGGTWRMPPDRQSQLEALLAQEDERLAAPERVSPA